MEAKKKDRQQEQQDRRQEEQDEQQEEKDRRQEEQDEQQELLDYAIEYCTCESYPPGLTKDKKRAVRKKAIPSHQPVILGSRPNIQHSCMYLCYL